MSHHRFTEALRCPYLRVLSLSKLRSDRDHLRTGVITAFFWIQSCTDQGVVLSTAVPHGPSGYSKR